MGFPLKHILCGKLCSFFNFFFFIFLFFGTSGTNRGGQAWRYSSVLNRCHLQITRHHPVFLCIYVCFLLTPSVLNHCLIPPFLGGVGGGKESKAAISRRLPHGGAGRAALASREPEVPASQTDPINKEFGERSISACLCALNERQRLQRHAY